MSKEKLSSLELKLKKLAVLAMAYADAKAADENVALIQKATANTGYAKTYILASGVTTENEVVASGAGKNLIGYIDIPKDFLVKSSKLLTVEAGTGANANKWMVAKENGTAVTAYEAPSTIAAAGEWLDFIVNSKDNDASDSHLSINLSSFIDTYTGGDGINITNKAVSVDLAAVAGLEISNGKLQLKLDSENANGLAVTSSGLKLAAATASTSGTGGTNGAMTAKDKETVVKANTDLLSDAELASWFGYASNSTMATTTLPAVGDDSITDEGGSGGGSGSYNTVDLGLPSGNLWADRNVGASSVEDNGLYFSWGNTTGQALSTNANAGELNNDNGFGYRDYTDAWDDGYLFDNTTYNSTSGKALSADLTSANDAAAVNMGGSWVMPSKDDFEELFDSENTSYEYTTQNGVNGLLITSLSNGNTLFLPAAGYGFNTTLSNFGNIGRYWTSSYGTNTKSYRLDFGVQSQNPSGDASRHYGYTVRAIQKGSNS